MLYLRNIWLVMVAVLWPVVTGAQELFPMRQPASSVPKGVLGVRYFSETYNEVGQLRNLFALKLMYGVTSRLTVEATPNVSNHHGKTLPPEFPIHNTPQIGVHLPYRFNGVNFLARYRFLSLDGQNSHFRMAVYGEYGWLKVAHDEAEPGLMDDNAGVGAGLIATYLHGHFAASVNAGAIWPFKYRGRVPDVIPGLPSFPATVTYGNGYVYDLSLGYLLFPNRMTSYKQTAWSVYLEFLGKTYDKVEMQVGNPFYALPQYYISTSNNRALQANNYVEVYPGLQAVIRSDTRVEVSVGFPLINRSYVRYYPVYHLGIQRYLFFHKHKR